ncbi:MAG: ABC transporter permease [Planctomycetota bacterium]
MSSDLQLADVNKKGTGSLGSLATAGGPSSLLTTEPKGWFDSSIDWIVEQFSSILVKESRQSLKSMQFLGTYTVLFAVVAFWTVIALFAIGSRVGRLDNDFAANLYCGYLVILGFPLQLIVPFTAFRSLAREYEDGTIQLISITTMKPYQIVVGKLATAMLQMVIYLSIVAPCVAFTSFLNGISFSQIFLGLLISVVSCFAFTVFGLLLAGASRSYAIGMAVSAVFVLGLGAAYYGWCNFVWEVLYNEFDAVNADTYIFAMSCFGSVAFVMCTALVMLGAAASQISFPTDNRSTVPRLLMLGQLVFFFALVAMLPSQLDAMADPAWGYAIAIFVGHYWMVMGALLVGESGGISRRVMRGMPKSILGRSFFSLLMPGPGRGLIFAFGCMFSCVMIVGLIQYNMEFFKIDELKQPLPFRGPMMGLPGPDSMWVSAYKYAALLLHPCLVLSLTFLIMKFVRQFLKRKFQGAGGPILGLIIAVALLFIITLSSVGATAGQYQRGSLGPSGAWNWYVAIEFIARQNELSVKQTMFLTAWLAPVMLTTALTTGLAFFVACRDLRYSAMKTPDRVSQDIEMTNRVIDDGESIDDALGLASDSKDDSKTSESKT